MIQPTIDELMKKVDSRYTLVVVAAKRARTLTEKGSGMGDGAAIKPVTAALLEIAQNKVIFKKARLDLK